MLKILLVILCSLVYPLMCMNKNETHFSTCPQNLQGTALLNEAIRLRDRERMNTLLWQNSTLVHSIDDELGEEPIFLAVAGGSRRTIECLMTNGASIFSLNSLGNQPIHRAAISGKRWFIASVKTAVGSSRIITYLIEHGADINARNKKGESPLKCALDKLYNTEAIVCLLEHGARLDTLQDNDINFLLIFLRENDPLLYSMLTLLLSPGSNTHAFDELIARRYKKFQKEEGMDAQKRWASYLSRVLMIASAHGSSELMGRILQFYHSSLCLIPPENVERIVLAAVRNGHEKVFDDFCRCFLVRYQGFHLKEIFHKVLLAAALSRRKEFLESVLSHQRMHLDVARVNALLCEVKKILCALESMIAEFPSEREALAGAYRDYYRSEIVPLLESFLVNSTPRTEENVSRQSSISQTLRNFRFSVQSASIRGSFIGSSTHASDH